MVLGIKPERRAKGKVTEQLSHSPNQSIRFHTDKLQDKEMEICLRSKDTTNIERGSVGVSNKPEGPAHHFPLLWLQVLEHVKLAANDGEGQGERVKQVTVWMTTAESVPCSLAQSLLQARLTGLHFHQHC